MLDVWDSPAMRQAQEAERCRIARELHDGVVQSLTALVADLEYFQTRYLPTIDQTNRAVAEKVATWQELARDSLTSMRHALGELRQPDDLAFGLEYAIQTVLTELREAGYTVVFEYLLHSTRSVNQCWQACTCDFYQHMYVLFRRPSACQYK